MPSEQAPILAPTLEWRWQPRAEAWSALVGLARRATQAQPGKAAGWLSLARLLADGGREEEAVAVLEEAAVKVPADPGLRLELAVALQRMGRFEAALAEAERATELQPGLPGAEALRFVLLVKLGRLADAGPLAEAAAAADPCEPTLFEQSWAAASRPDSLERLIGRCDAALAINRGCANAVYFKAMALARLGRAEDAREMMRLDEAVAVSAPASPAEFADKDAFLSALAAAIRDHPTLRASPRGKATREGQQTGRLEESDDPALRAMVRLIRDAVARYVASPAGNGYAPAPGDKLKLAMWATLCGPEGHQTSHRHPDGWISGVYYVAAPRDADGRYAGSLVVGAVPGKDSASPPWGTRLIEPVPGRMVLFPSHMPHATEPSGLAGERISVAFDVVPLAS